ncbi:hypothetical protein Pogu_1884 [Pyrobaculum oguniense TE7]|uniref:Uncharacterized protein n=1 Tax=Pyrobaculum oguniense (strain DSM 13380 / JCM 10595 / TE7) TaxID=698757 RepID=H6QAY8_PYROT|nr:hypothetical protein Pogu_1884 [Pyrobaculum oguniense TE7]
MAEWDFLGLFEEYLRSFVVGYVGGVEGVDLEDVFFSPEAGLVVGYVVRHRHGEACILPMPEEGPGRVGGGAA